MGRTLFLFCLAGLCAILAGCSSMGEQTAPKPDPAQFMKNNPPSEGGTATATKP